jgi:arylsulfate sulfotransferase
MGFRPPVRRLFPLALVGLILLAGCDANSTAPDPDFITNLTVTPNPTGYAPLTAELELTTSRPVAVEVVVPGRNGGEEVRHRFPSVSQQARLPILGLYPGVDNTITLRFLDPAGTLLGEVTRTITTPSLLRDFPRITVNSATPAAMTPGMNLVSYFGYYSQLTPQRPFIFDTEGAIRWYLDFTHHPNLMNLFYDCGVARLANGNLYFGDGSTGRIIEMDMLGRIVHQWTMPGYGFHHNVIEKPNGNFVATVNKWGVATVEDYVIEIDRTTGAIVREWNLNQSLDHTRRAWPMVGDENADWFHGNGLAYDPRDDAIIVSGRTQGVVKLTNDNQVVWILAPHREWGTAGDGTDLSTKLLQPLDANGQPITDPAVLDGTANHPDFEWNWYQHAPKLMPDGTLLVFDNGDNRNYVDQPWYSRAVAFRINADAMTVQQLWQYGKERGTETFSRVISDVAYHAAEDNIMFSPGAVSFSGVDYGKVIEVSRTTRAVVFEATVTPPTSAWGMTFHRAERLSLYPPD